MFFTVSSPDVDNMLTLIIDETLFKCLVFKGLNMAAPA